jgi:hypothetical protein
VKAIIKDMSKDAESIIEHMGKQTDATKWTKGVKQGCPLTQVLFNVCLESLLRVMKRDENIYRAYVPILEAFVMFIFQVYADDVLFISENRDGIFQMSQIPQSFVHWSRMEVKVGKCATASYVLDNERRQA